MQMIDVLGGVNQAKLSRIIVMMPSMSFIKKKYFKDKLKQNINWSFFFH